MSNEVVLAVESMLSMALVLEVCHWLGDFTHLSTNWMLNAKKLGTPLLPILVHAGIHTALFFSAVFYFHGLDKAILAAEIQLPTHFWIDVLKGKMNALFPSLQDPANKFHWWMFGFDQCLHQIVILLTAALVTI